MGRTTLLRVAFGTALVLASACTLSACSSDESKLYDIFKCGKAATVLGHGAQANAAAQKAKPYLQNVQSSRAMYMGRLGGKLQDELGSQSPAQQVATFQELYASRTCRQLYE